MNLGETVKNYLAAWSQSDGKPRNDLLETAFSEAGSYTDPLVRVTNRKTLSRLIGHAQSLFPGAILSLSGEIQCHQGGVLFPWDMCSAEGQLMLQGTDFAELDAQGKIKRVEAFFPSAGLEAYGAFEA